MNLTITFAKNIFNTPLLCFLFGIIASVFSKSLKIPKKLSTFLTVYILFCIGLKGGAPLAENANSSAILFISVTICLILWGFLNPLLSFLILKKFTRLDGPTLSAIAASFGSVSVMTFITATSFLEQIQVNYEKFVIAALAVMEVPAIISGVFIAKTFDKDKKVGQTGTSKAIRKSLCNKAIISILSGIIVGLVFYKLNIHTLNIAAQYTFKPALCLFLLDLGLRVGSQREHLSSFSKALTTFGIYMPLIGGMFGLILSYLLHLDVGTGTLIAIISASASYIAVPAAMRIALPEAKEAIYLPLSLGIAFPFNVIIGIPLYYYLSLWLLK